MSFTPNMTPKEIRELDKEGMRLTKEILGYLPNTSKIKYFSEGQPKYLW